MMKILIICIGMLAPAAFASAIGTYVFTGVASGSLGGTNFTNATLTITATGDTQNIQPGFNSFNELDFAPGDTKVTISGIGTAGFTNFIYVVDDFGTGVLNLGGLFSQGNLVLISMTNASVGSTAFSNYFLSTSLGPLGEAADNVTNWLNLPTSSGPLSLDSYTNVSFQAGVTPEPRTFVLLPLGLAALLLIKKRKGTAA